MTIHENSWYAVGEKEFIIFSITILQINLKPKNYEAAKIDRLLQWFRSEHVAGQVRE